MPVVCTEAGRWSADVLGMNDRICIEVEIKKSIADLRSEFRHKTAKHFLYESARQGPVTPFVPNYFYFFVPGELGAKTLEVVKEHNDWAGVAALHRPARTAFAVGKRNISVLRPPKIIHRQPPTTRMLQQALMRMGSEVCGFRIAIEKMKQSQDPLTEKLISEMAYAARVQAGRLDFEAEADDLEIRAQELAFAVEGLVWAEADADQRQRWISAVQKLIDLAYQGLEARRAEIG